MYLRHLVLIVVILLTSWPSNADVRGAVSMRGQTSHRHAFPVSNLEAWWELINSAGGTGHSGETIADSSGNGHTITISGLQNPSWPVPSAQGMVFATGYFSPVLGATLSLAGNAPKTIVTVFNSALNASQGYIFVTDRSQQAAGVFLEYERIGNDGGEFSTVPDITCAVFLRGAPIPDNQWTFGSVRYNGDDTYIQNTNVDAPVTGSIANPSGCNHAPTTMTVGPNVSIGSGGNTAWYGTIAEVLVFSKSLSNAELTLLYNFLKVRLAAVSITLP